MKRLFIPALLLGTLPLLFVSVAAADDRGRSLDRKVANKQCKAEKRALGNAAFREKYGKRAMRACKREERQEARQERRNAARECRAERDEIGEEAFQEKYGTNRNKRNAFGKCVSGKVREEAAEERAEVRNAAQECRAERDEIGEEAFEEKYGTNRNKRNAFGKCVSGKVRDEGADDGGGKPEDTPGGPPENVPGGPPNS